MSSNGRFQERFITPSVFEKVEERYLAGPNGWLLFAACNSGMELGAQVRREYEGMLRLHGVGEYEIPLLGTPEEPITRVFDDTETCPRLPEHVAGSNAYVFQSTHDRRSENTVNENIQQLLQVVRTLRAHRAMTVTVVTPYAPYSRQDKPSFMRREAVLARLFADQLEVAGANALLTYHPHERSLYGFYEPKMTFVALSGMDLFIDLFDGFRGWKDVVCVATDAGSAGFNVVYGGAMQIPYAIANKFRREKDETDLLGIIGDVQGKKIAIITDDEMSTGGSVRHTVESLHTQYEVEKIYVAVSHMKMQPAAVAGLVEAHEKYGLAEVHVTDTVPQTQELMDLPFVTVHSLARRFAATINRLHYNRSVSDLFFRL